MADRSDSSLLAFILGGIIGGALGVLFAPRPGKETRYIVANMIDDLHEKSVGTIKKAKIKASDIYNDSKGLVKDEKGKIKSVIDAGKEAYTKKEK